MPSDIFADCSSSSCYTNICFSGGEHRRARHNTLDEYLPEQVILSALNRPWWEVLHNNSYVGFLRQIAHPENFFVLACSLASTLFFCLYVDPNTHLHIASKMNFTLIATVVIFPALFMANMTGIRRDQALEKFGVFRGRLCELLIAYLNWRSQLKTPMGDEWDARTRDACIEYANIVCEIMLLPALIVRHTVGGRGSQFTARILAARRKRIRKMAKLTIILNSLVEDLKDHGLVVQESMMAYSFTMALHRDTEQILMMKYYRSSESSRVFVRVMVFACIMFYGPYFSFVAGNLVNSQGGQTNVVFSSLLCVVMTTTLIGVISLQRNLEDPFREGPNTLQVRRERERLEAILHAIYEQAKAKQSITLQS